MSRNCMVLLIAGSLMVGCNSTDTKKDKSMSKETSDTTSMKAKMNEQAAPKMAAATIRPSKAATTQPVANDVMGTVTFTQAPDGMNVNIHLTGLPPNSTHGIHIHDKGDMSAADLMSVGAHFNPEGHKHGGPNSPMAHAGDFGNITSDANGAVNTDIMVKGVTLDNSPTGIIGRSVIIHAKADDLKTDPSGNSGARVAGGVIEAK